MMVGGPMVGGQLESRWINSYERLTLSQMGFLSRASSNILSQMGAYLQSFELSRTFSQKLFTLSQMDTDFDTAMVVKKYAAFLG